MFLNVINLHSMERVGRCKQKCIMVFGSTMLFLFTFLHVVASEAAQRRPVAWRAVSRSMEQQEPQKERRAPGLPGWMSPGSRPLQIWQESCWKPDRTLCGRETNRSVTFLQIKKTRNAKALTRVGLTWTQADKCKTIVYGGIFACLIFLSCSKAASSFSPSQKTTSESKCFRVLSGWIMRLIWFNSSIISMLL